MARELVWTGFTTVDGYIDSPGHSKEGHPGGGWVLQTEFDEAAYELKGTELEETSALMFGRTSYDAFAPVWVKSPDHVAYRDLPKFVVSSTLDEGSLIEGWGDITVLRSTDDVAALKETDGGAIFIHGSGELARRLGEAGLIDRYNMLVFPALLGSGKRAFPAGGTGQKLVLRDSASYANGVVKTVYAVAR
jgi:dihydrofolate reductase